MTAVHSGTSRAPILATRDRKYAQIVNTEKLYCYQVHTCEGCRDPVLQGLEMVPLAGSRRLAIHAAFPWHAL